MSAVPTYEALVKSNPFDRWQLMINAAYPADSIPQGLVHIYRGRLTAVIASDRTYIRLPNGHPWFKQDPNAVIEADGFATNTIGIAMNFRHFPLHHLNPDIRKWLLSKFTTEQIRELFDDDVYAGLGMETPRRWLCITYDNLIHPRDASSATVKLGREYRRLDAHNAVEAILAAMPTEEVGFPLVASRPIAKPKPAAMDTPLVASRPIAAVNRLAPKPENSEWQTVKPRRR